MKTVWKENLSTWMDELKQASQGVGMATDFSQLRESSIPTTDLWMQQAMKEYLPLQLRSEISYIDSSNRKL